MGKRARVRAGQRWETERGPVQIRQVRRRGARSWEWLVWVEREERLAYFDEAAKFLRELKASG